MAEGWLRHLGRGRYEVESAGTEPSVVNPTAIRVMAEVGIDLSRPRSKHVREFLGRDFDVVVTVCDQARESCPVFPGCPVVAHWPIPDPARFEGPEAARLEHFREIRDRIGGLIRGLVERDSEGETPVP
jgi:arsenate reductase